MPIFDRGEVIAVLRTRLPENISRREPEGYLLCLNVPAAGQIYLVKMTLAPKKWCTKNRRKQEESTLAAIFGALKNQEEERCPISVNR